MAAFGLIECWTCKEHYPRYFFTSLPEGWYSRSGHNYSCKMCSLTRFDVKYKRVKALPFDRLEPYVPDWDERLADFFRREQ